MYCVCKDRKDCEILYLFTTYKGPINRKFIKIFKNCEMFGNRKSKRQIKRYIKGLRSCLK